MMRTIPQLMKMTHDNAVARGWIPDKIPLNKDNVAALMMHLYDEMIEAGEALRDHDSDYYYYGPDGKPEGFRFELADIMILIMEIAHCTGINLYGAIREKMTYNETREDK